MITVPTTTPGIYALFMRTELDTCYVQLHRDGDLGHFAQASDLGHPEGSRVEGGHVWIGGFSVDLDSHQTQRVARALRLPIIVEQLLEAA